MAIIKKMKQRFEIRWILFLFAILLASFGLLTGYSFGEMSDIQMHDTYFVIANSHLLILLSFLLAFSYFLTLGLKILAKLNSAFKMISIIISGLIALGMLVLLVLSVLFYTPHITGQNLISFGLIILIFGFAILFSFRTRELWKIK